jgi:predicted nuclease of restriction endonuclease-like (RecB) superfamily
MIRARKNARPQRDYRGFVVDIGNLLVQARRQAARSVNAILTATYWEVGRRIVKFEQEGKSRAGYGEGLLKRLSDDLTRSFGRGFSVDHLELMRKFYFWRPAGRISESMIRKSSSDNPAEIFPLSWTHYVRLLRVPKAHARCFYETETLRGGWSVRQLDRQIQSLFFERTALSRNKPAMLTKGTVPKLADKVTPEEEIKDPYVLEFLGLKDEYSESEMEEALIKHLESFLLELGGDFTFMARQKRLRIGNSWYRVDLVFYHRRLRCLVLIDLKMGSFTHADAGQMHLYLNYARKNWTYHEENPPVGLILCAEKDTAVVRYALEGLPNKILASEYRMALPDTRTIAREIRRTQIRACPLPPRRP